MGWLRCEPDVIFKDHEYTVTAAAKRLSPAAVARLAKLGERLPPALAAWAWNFRVVAAPMQLHALVRFFLEFAGYSRESAQAMLQTASVAPVLQPYNSAA